jgi:hypothetical protein
MMVVVVVMVMVMMHRQLLVVRIPKSSTMCGLVIECL